MHVLPHHIPIYSLCAQKDGNNHTSKNDVLGRWYQWPEDKVHFCSGIPVRMTIKYLVWRFMHRFMETLGFRVFSHPCRSGLGWVGFMYRDY